MYLICVFEHFVGYWIQMVCLEYLREKMWFWSNQGTFRQFSSMRTCSRHTPRFKTEPNRALGRGLGKMVPRPGSCSPQTVQMCYVFRAISLSSDWTVCDVTYGFEALDVYFPTQFTACQSKFCTERYGCLSNQGSNKKMLMVIRPLLVELFPLSVDRDISCMLLVLCLESFSVSLLWSLCSVSLLFLESF